MTTCEQEEAGILLRRIFHTSEYSNITFEEYYKAVVHSINYYGNKHVSEHHRLDSHNIQSKRNAGEKCQHRKIFGKCRKLILANQRNPHPQRTAHSIQRNMSRFYGVGINNYFYTEITMI